MTTEPPSGPHQPQDNPPLVPTTSRPIGPLRPSHDRALRAWIALEEHRLRDVEPHLAAVSEDSRLLRAWKHFLAGALAEKKLDFEAARELLSAGFPDGQRPFEHHQDSADELEERRLTATAWELLGVLNRRREELEEARQLHESAFRIRREVGSLEENWESALSAGLDAQLLRQWDDALNWYSLAAELGESCTLDPARRQAEALTHRIRCLLECDRREDAVAAARAARQAWKKHDAAAITSVKADARLGHALLQLGIVCMEQDAEKAPPLLDEAIGWLTAARDELLAFGDSAAVDANWCAEQLDFAERLLATSLSK